MRDGLFGVRKINRNSAFAFHGINKTKKAPSVGLFANASMNKNLNISISTEAA